MNPNLILTRNFSGSYSPRDILPMADGLLFSPIIYRIFMLKEAILSTFPSSALKTFNTTGRAFHPVSHRTDTFAESLT